MNFNIYEIFIFILGLGIFYLCYIKRIKISNTFNLFDKPDNKRKLHKSNTPLTGALSIYLIFVIVSLYNFFIKTADSSSLIILLSCSFIFFTGFLDDIINLSPYKKLFLISLIFFIFLNLNESFILRELYFITLDKKYSIVGNWSVFFTILCLLLFINSVNLMDGINGLANIIISCWLLYLLLIDDNNLTEIFSILIWFLFLNSYFIYNGKYFIGNSGSLFYASLIGMFAIYNYNTMFENQKSPTVEEIFILFMIPGYDMLRLFIERILKGKNPFSGDRNHLHHFLIKIFTLKKTLIIYTSITMLPILLNYYLNISEIIIIISSLIVYFCLIYILKGKVTSLEKTKKVI
jgi:UDP-GlcNAc:undecaprenyl-phosphate GlcNAc-1-phosphate transferase